MNRARRRALPLTRGGRVRGARTTPRWRCIRSTSSRTRHALHTRALDGRRRARDARQRGCDARRRCTRPETGSSRSSPRTRADLGARASAEHARRQTLGPVDQDVGVEDRRAAPPPSARRSAHRVRDPPDSASRSSASNTTRSPRVVAREHRDRGPVHELGRDRPLVDRDRRAQLHRHPPPQRRVEVVAPGQPGRERLRLRGEGRRGAPVDGDRDPALVLHEEIGERGVGSSATCAITSSHGSARGSTTTSPSTIRSSP